MGGLQDANADISVQTETRALDRNFRQLQDFLSNRLSEHERKLEDLLNLTVAPQGQLQVHTPKLEKISAQDLPAEKASSKHLLALPGTTRISENVVNTPSANGPSLSARIEAIGTKKRDAGIYPPIELTVVPAVRSSEAVLEGSEGRVRKFAKRITSNREFELLVLAIIVINVVVTMVELELTTRVSLQDLPRSLDIVNTISTTLFVVELLLRLLSRGFRYFFTGDHAKSNALDTLIVVAATVDMVSGWAFNVSTSPDMILVFRLNRLFRVLRGTRLILTVRFIRPLRLLLLSISKSLRSLFWTGMLVSVIILSFAFVFAESVLNYCRKEVAESSGAPEATVIPSCSDDILTNSWSSLGRSVLTLFLASTGGNEYGDVLGALFNVNYALPLLLLIYAFLMVFAIFNVVTGIFCQVALENGMSDKENLVMSQMVKRQDSIKALREVFAEMDSDGNGVLSETEFRTGLQESRVAAFFDSIGMDTSDAYLLFRILDEDKSCTVDIDEFISGCTALRGPATGFHMAKMRSELTASHRLQKQICKHSECMSASLSQLASIVKRSSGESSKSTEKPGCTLKL